MTQELVLLRSDTAALKNLYSELSEVLGRNAARQARELLMTPTDAGVLIGKPGEPSPDAMLGDESLDGHKGPAVKS